MGLKNDLTSHVILSKINRVRELASHQVCRDALALEIEQALLALSEGKMELEGLMPWSSNYTFLVHLRQSNGRDVLGIYKPCEGERPLWDFPDGTLCYREFTSYLVSLALGWPNIPPTILRNGPHGPGSVQLFIEAEYEAHYFNMRDTVGLNDEFRRIALFDYVINNADRKGGHCLKDKDGQIWCIDHGLTFHADFKLRTVIWEYCQETIPASLQKDLERLRALMTEPSELCQILAHFISPREIQAFRSRLERLLSARQLPRLHPGRNVPFPPV